MFQYMKLNEVTILSITMTWAEPLHQLHLGFWIPLLHHPW